MLEFRRDDVLLLERATNTECVCECEDWLV